MLSKSKHFQQAISVPNKVIKIRITELYFTKEIFKFSYKKKILTILTLFLSKVKKNDNHKN